MRARTSRAELNRLLSKRGADPGVQLIMAMAARARVLIHGRGGYWRFVALYLLLVGIPVLAVVAVIEGFQDAVAPSDVSGKWVILAADSPLPCQARTASLTALEITQSGRFLVIKPDCLTGGFGRIEQYRMNAELVLTVDSDKFSCSGSRALTLVAELDPVSGILAGSFANCAFAAPIKFTAARKPRTDHAI